MSELTKTWKKQSTRLEQKLLESLGRAQKTADPIFDEYNTNFLKQQASASKLRNELNNYASKIKAVSAASKSLFEALRDSYDDEWPEKQHIVAITQTFEIQWDQYSDRLVDEVISPLGVYCDKFPELKARIAKRGRKLLDFDGAKHDVETLQNQTKKNPEKLKKAQDHYEQTKFLYTEINNELLEELPNFYDNRIAFWAQTLETLFSLEETVHGELMKEAGFAKESVEKFRHKGLTGELNLKRMSLPVSTPEEEESKEKINGEQEQTKENNGSSPLQPIKEKEATPTPTAPVAAKRNVNLVLKDAGKPSYDEENNPFADSPDEKKAQPQIQQENESIEQKELEITADSEDKESKEEKLTEEAKEADVTVKNKEPPASELSVTENGTKPSKVLHKVITTYPYAAEDEDELSFDVGETISVVEFDIPDEEQDEGWSMGVLESTGRKGVFPLNFTKQL